MAFGRRPGSAAPLTDGVAVRDLALRLLADRPHLAAELERKLLHRGAAPDLVAQVLARLRRDQLLDDTAVARRLAEETTRQRRWGASRVALELRRRGAGSDAVEAALSDLEDPLTLARDAATRWLRRRSGRPGRPGDAARLARHLAGLGHPSSAIGTLLRELASELDDASAPHE